MKIEPVQPGDEIRHPNKVYRVSYWDPCNGIGGRSKDYGLFATIKAAKEFILPKATSWDTQAYSYHEVMVHE